MGALVPPDDLPTPSRVVPADDLPDEPGTAMRVLKTAGSTLWNMVKPGQYPQAAPAPSRNPGESDRDYALRSAREAFKWQSTPEGISNAALMVGGTMPGNTGGGTKVPQGPLAGIAEAAAVRSANADRTAFRRAFKGNDEARHDLGRFMLDTGMPLRSPAAIRDAAQDIAAGAGPEIGRVAQAADQAGAAVNLAQAVAAAKASRSISRLSRNTVTRNAHDQVVGMLDDQIARNGGQVTPSTAHDIRMQIDELATWDQAAPKQLVKAWRAAREAVDAELEKSIQGAGLGHEWSEANAAFRKSRLLSNPQKKGLADIGAERREGNRWGSPSEKGAAVAGAVTAGVANPVAGVALPLATVAVNRFGMPVVARTADALSKRSRSTASTRSAAMAQALRGRPALVAAEDEE